MSTGQPEIISHQNLSYAWLKLFKTATERHGGRIDPVVVTVGELSNNGPTEDSRVRSILDSALLKYGLSSTAISASTIFPYRHWIRMGRPPRNQLFSWYLERLLPRLKARDPRNRHGTYFERMIAFTGTKRTSHGIEVVTKNQLEHIINRLAPNSKPTEATQAVRASSSLF